MDTEAYSYNLNRFHICIPSAWIDLQSNLINFTNSIEEALVLW